MIPFSLLKKFQQLVPSAQVFTFENEGHSIAIENPQICVECIAKVAQV